MRAGHTKDYSKVKSIQNDYTGPFNISAVFYRNVVKNLKIILSILLGFGVLHNCHFMFILIDSGVWWVFLAHLYFSQELLTKVNNE